MDLWWPLLLITGVLASILGPIMMLQPNKRQRELAALRQLAVQRGIRVRLDMRLEKPGGRQQPAIAVYSLMWPTAVKTEHWLLKRQHFGHDLHFSNDWDWADEHRPPHSWLLPLKAIIMALPPDVVGLEGAIDSLGVFWLEKKGQTDLATIEKLLRHSQTMLLNLKPPVKSTADA